MRLRYASLALIAAGLLATASSARGQFDEYRPPGAVVEVPADRKGQLEKASSEARWRLGPVHVDPWWELRDIQYVDNAVGSTTGGESGDVTGTAGAGLRAYFRTGRKLYWAAHALPEYVWWRDAVDRRRVDGRYGVGVFGFWNRLRVEATAARSQQQGFVSPESASLTHARADRVALSVDVEVTDRIVVFASGADSAVRNLVSAKAGEPAFDALDRDEQIVRGGVLYRLPRGVSIGAGVERSETDFAALAPVRDRSNRGTSPFLAVRQQNEDRFFEIEVAARTAEPTAGSVFVPFDSTTARLSAGFNTSGRLSTFVYGGRGIVYTLAQGYSYLEDDRVGAAVQLKVGRSANLRTYLEAGKNDYRAAVAGTPSRSDDTLSFGGSFDMTLGRHGSVGVHVARSEFRSNLPGFDRSITAIGAGFSFRSGSNGWY